VTVHTETSKSVVLTDGAAAKVKALLDQEGRDDLRLRVAVQPGGCSGLRYQLFFDERSLDGDVVSVFAAGGQSDEHDRGGAFHDGTVDQGGGAAVAAGSVKDKDWDNDRHEATYDGPTDQPGGVAVATRSVEVVVDRMSAPYLAGATIDFVDTIEKQGFTIDNPNAGGSCACGDSFH